MEERENIILLTDDEGNEQAYEHLDFFEYSEKEYVVLLEVKEDGESDEETVIIFEVKEVDDETDEFLPVDDETLEKVFEVFKVRYEEGQ